MAKKRIIFIDGDDTLWDTQLLYDRAISAARKQVRRKGIDVSRWSKAVDEAEKELIPKYGFAKERFAAALVMAYRELCKHQGKTPIVELSKTIQRLGMGVFEEKAPLFPRVANTLEAISAHVPLYLVSAGPEDVQKERLLDSGLKQFLAGYHFPPSKTSEVFGTLIKEFNVEAARSWHIGNSIRSDINPARKSGLNAILIKGRGWAHDKVKLHKAKTSLKKVHQLSGVIPILHRYYKWSKSRYKGTANMTVTPKEVRRLLQVASRAREQSYSPYSRYKVGAAVLSSDGRIFSGTNVENASYGLTVCAERVAIFKGISEGVKKLKAIAVVSTGSANAYPCGACLQVIQEFGESCSVILERKGNVQKISLRDLLPYPFRLTGK